MSDDTHRLLKRQMRKYLPEGIDPEALKPFLDAVNSSYNHYEQDREMLERAMDLSSRELLESNIRITHEAEKLRETEAVVREREQLLESINTNIREAIFRGSVEQGLVYANKAVIQMFQLDTEEEAIGRSMEAFMKGSHQGPVLLQKIRQKGMLDGEEVEFVRKDGTTFWGLLSVIPIRSNDGDVYFDGAIVDISNRKRAEQALKKMNHKLKKTNSELDRFVYSASHDLRAPLTSLLGLVNLLNHEELPEAVKHYTHLMERTVEKMDVFIQDIINYSVNARTELNPERIDFLELAQNSYESFLFMPGSDSIRFEVDRRGDSEFYTDLRRLNILFNNLLSNSIKYHNYDQECPKVRIRVEVTPDFAEIAFCDNGQGIPAHHQDNIFNMFYRASDQGTGTGLGLYIVKEAIDKLGGSIRVFSREGKGTTFTVTLPNLEREADREGIQVRGKGVAELVN